MYRCMHYKDVTLSLPLIVYHLCIHVILSITSKILPRTGSCLKTCFNKHLTQHLINFQHDRVFAIEQNTSFAS